MVLLSNRPPDKEVMQHKYDWLEMTSSLSVSRRLVLVV